MPSLVAGIIIARSSLSDVKCPVICNPNACDDGKIMRVPFSVDVYRHLWQFVWLCGFDPSLTPLALDSGDGFGTGDSARAVRVVLVWLFDDLDFCG
jgi:hypothetical protein